MPYFIGDLLEIPLTDIQDYSLFNILNEYSIDIWKRQTAMILATARTDELHRAPGLHH